MKMFNVGRLLMYTLLGITLMMCASACINEYGDCPEGDEGLIRLSFTVITKTSTLSRAGDDCVDDFPASVPEDYLNINNLNFLIFDSAGDFVSDITAKSQIQLDFSNPGITIYRVITRLDEPFFTEAVDNNQNTPINFSILAFANYDGWDIHFPPLQAGLTLDDLFADGAVMNTVPDTQRMLEAGTPAANPLCFPMAGVQSFTINPRALLNTSEDSPYNLSGGTAGGRYINLLRAVAKIEVIDKINIPDGAVFSDEDKESPLRIASAQLDGYMTKGSILPARNLWPAVPYFQSANVMLPTVPHAASYMRPPALLANNEYGTDYDAGYELAFKYDPAATARRDDLCPVYSCYVFEYTQGTIPANQQPYVRITTKGSEEYEPVERPMRVAVYDDGTPEANREFLIRNHIYRFEITGISQEVTFNWTVCPMDNAEANIEFN